MAATGISNATTTRTAGTLAAGDNVPLGATGLKAKIAASALLQGLANVTADAAAVRTALGVPSGTGTVSGANTGDQDLSSYATTAAVAAGYQPLDADLTALAALSGTNTIYYRSAASTWSAVTVGSGLSFTTGTLSASGGGSFDYAALSGLTALAAADVAAGDLFAVGDLSVTTNKKVVASDLLKAIAAVTADAVNLYESAADSRTWVRFNPRYSSDNPAFSITSTETANPFGGERNFVFTWGHNTDSGGNRINTAKGQLIMHYESNWQPAADSRVQEMLFSILSRESGRQANRVMAIYSEDHTSNASYGNITFQSHFTSRQYFHHDLSAYSGTSWMEEGPGLRVHYDRAGNTAFSFDLDADGVTFSTSPITGTDPRDFTFELATANSRFNVSSFYIDPTAGRVNFGFAVNAFTAAGTVTIAGGNLALDNDTGVYLKTVGGTQFLALTVDNADNVSYRNTIAAAANTYYGNSSGSNTGTVLLQTKGSNRLSVAQNGQFLFTPNGTDTMLTVDANGLGFYGTAGGAKPTITGSRGGNAALASLLTALATRGLITDSTSA